MKSHVVVFEGGADGAISAYTPSYPIAVSAPDRTLAKEKILEAIQIYWEEVRSSGFLSLRLPSSM